MKEQIEEYKKLYDDLLGFPDYLNVMIPEIETEEDRDFKCCCPLHEENTPSFLYSKTMKVWTCFGSCHTTGKTVHFHHLYMKKKYGGGVTLVQAMKNLQSTFAHILPEMEFDKKEKSQTNLADAIEAELAKMKSQPMLAQKDEHENNKILDWFVKDNY